MWAVPAKGSKWCSHREWNGISLTATKSWAPSTSKTASPATDLVGVNDELKGWWQFHQRNQPAIVIINYTLYPCQIDLQYQMRSTVIKKKTEPSPSDRGSSTCSPMVISLKALAALAGVFTSSWREDSSMPRVDNRSRKASSAVDSSPAWETGGVGVSNTWGREKWVKPGFIGLELLIKSCNSLNKNSQLLCLILKLVWFGNRTFAKIYLEGALAMLLVISNIL